MAYYVELNQIDPPDSPTPGLGHYAGELTDFPTAIEALAAGIAWLGKPAGEAFHPCCDWQKPETPIVGCVVYWEDADGNRAEDNPIQARLKEPITTTQEA